MSPPWLLSTPASSTKPDRPTRVCLLGVVRRAKLWAMVPSIVRGLALPALLTSLIDRDLWRHPGDAVLAKAIPWFKDSLVFVSNPEQMELFPTSG